MGDSAALSVEVAVTALPAAEPCASVPTAASVAGAFAPLVESWHRWPFADSTADAQCLASAAGSGVPGSAW